MADDQRMCVLLTPQQLQDKFLAVEDVTILAVQSINPYTGTPSIRDVRIPGALDTEAYSDFAATPTATSGQRPLPRVSELEAKARRWGLRPESTIVVYDSDRSMTAARAWWVLRWAGLPDVRVLDGGLPAWRAADLPVTTAVPSVTPSTIRLSPGNMPELDAAGAAALARSGVLLDARIRPNYIGGPVAAGQPARGHVPGAISAPAPDNVTDYGNFTDSATLREMYRVLGADGTTPVGVYCGAGMSAAHTTLALAAIGISAAMYPGSWSQWVTDPTRPVVMGGLPG